MLILVDFLIEHFDVVGNLRSKGFDTSGIVAIAKKSESFGRAEMLEAEKTVRWFHIDGEHSAEATYADIALADRFISNRGVIVLDDFFNARYVSVASGHVRLSSKSSAFLADDSSGRQQGLFVQAFPARDLP